MKPSRDQERRGKEGGGSGGSGGLSTSDRQTANGHVQMTQKGFRTHEAEFSRNLGSLLPSKMKTLLKRKARGCGAGAMTSATYVKTPRDSQPGQPASPHQKIRSAIPYGPVSGNCGPTCWSGCCTRQCVQLRTAPRLSLHKIPALMPTHSDCSMPKPCLRPTLDAKNSHSI